MYDSSEVLDLTVKGGNSRSATTTSSPVTTEEAENLDNTIIYQETNEDEQPEVIEIPEQDEFTSVGRGSISQLGSLMTWSLKLSKKYQRIWIGKRFTCSKLLQINGMMLQKMAQFNYEKFKQS